MEKVKIKLCMGTMCYVMGGAQIKDLLESLPPETAACIDIGFSPCLGYCDEKKNPPYILLNGRLLSGVNKNNLIQLIQEEIKNVIR